METTDRNLKNEHTQHFFGSITYPLTLADLVRNYLLLGMTAEKQEILYKQYWLHMERRLNNISGFIRDFMQLKAGTAFNKATESNYKKLYMDFKEIFEAKGKEQLIQEMDSYSELYSYVVMGVDCKNTSINEKLADIREIGATTSYSFILGLLNSWRNENLTDTDMIELLNVLCIFFIRRRIIGLSASENKVMPTLIKHINEIIQAEDKSEIMFNILSKLESTMRLPNDLEMCKNIQSMNFYNFRYARFILSLIEEKITKSRPDPTDESLQIEHIMPQKLSAGWKKELGTEWESIHQELCNNIGNLTLIRHNQELGQKLFAEKKEIYEHHSGLQIAKSEIINQDKWCKENIENRQKWLIDRILYEVCPIPDNKRKTNNFSSKKTHGLSFIELQLIGETITYCKDRSIIAEVVDDTKISFLFLT